VNWKRGSGSSAILALLVFVGAGFCVYQARRYAIAAPNARTTTAHVVSVYHSIFRGLRFNYYSCSYDFSIDGSLYLGLRDCPQWIIDDAVKGRHLGSAAVWAGADATVYFDPANPSLNSLLDFRTESQIQYRVATPWIGLGVLIVFFFILGKLMLTSEKRENGGVIVDGRGTVIYPEEIGPGSASKSSHRGTVSPTLSLAVRQLYLEVVNKIHPDRATNEIDRAWRDRLMMDANAAFERGDAEKLRNVLEEYINSNPAS
jgi:Protein of unknown function (DUF3592)